MQAGKVAPNPPSTVTSRQSQWPVPWTVPTAFAWHPHLQHLDRTLRYWPHDLRCTTFSFQLRPRIWTQSKYPRLTVRVSQSPSSLDLRRRSSSSSSRGVKTHACRNRNGAVQSRADSHDSVNLTWDSGLRLSTDSSLGAMSRDAMSCNSLLPGHPSSFPFTRPARDRPTWQLTPAASWANLQPASAHHTWPASPTPSACTVLSVMRCVRTTVLYSAVPIEALIHSNKPLTSLIPHSTLHWLC